MYTIAAIDIHKRVLMVAVATGESEVEDVVGQSLKFECRRFGTGSGERMHLVGWLQQRGVMEVVMESTALYWKPIWLELEPHFPKLHLAQAHSNRARKGRKSDFRDAKRLARRLMADELMLSFVPGAEQRDWRNITRGKQQLIEDRVRLQNQIEALLEEMRIKLSSVISDLFGQSGRRILAALANGESDPRKLAQLGDERLRATQEQLTDALRGAPSPMQMELLKLFLERLKLLDEQIEKLDKFIAGALKQHQDAIARLIEIPGFGVDSAQRLITEIGVDAAAFASPGEFSSWAGLCPGSNITAEENHGSRCPKGNPYVRHILNQVAHAAARKKGCHFQSVFRKHLPSLDYNGAVCVVAHRIARVVWKVLHQGVHYIEKGDQPTPEAKERRARKLIRKLRELGYNVTHTPISAEPVMGAQA